MLHWVLWLELYVVEEIRICTFRCNFGLYAYFFLGWLFTDFKPNHVHYQNNTWTTRYTHNAHPLPQDTQNTLSILLMYCPLFTTHNCTWRCCTDKWTSPHVAVRVRCVWKGKCGLWLGCSVEWSTVRCDSRSADWVPVESGRGSAL